MDEAKENVEQINNIKYDEVEKLNQDIQELKSQLFEERMNREADKNRFEKAMEMIHNEHQQRCLEMRLRFEKRSALDLEKTMQKFLVKHVFSVCDLLRNIIINLEKTKPEIAQTVSISLKGIIEALKSDNLEEVIVSEGDDYNSDIHNALEVVNSAEGDDVVNIVHKVYSNAWVIRKDDKTEAIRYADVSIEKINAKK